LYNKENWPHEKKKMKGYRNVFMSSGRRKA